MRGAKLLPTLLHLFKKIHQYIFIIVPISSKHFPKMVENGVQA